MKNPNVQILRQSQLIVCETYSASSTMNVEIPAFRLHWIERWHIDTWTNVTTI